MKKLLLFSLAVLMAALAARADVTINSTNFPDANFRSYLLSEYPSGTITTAQLNARTELNVFNKNISNMKGVEYFTRLTYLNCNYNNLTAIDVSALTQLTYLNVGMNQLTSINLDNNRALKELYLQNNKLSGKFILTYNSNLTTLWLHYNTSLDTLMCFNNALNDLSVGNCSGLKLLNCSTNQLTSLNLNGCARLKTLRCNDNQLTNLSLTSCSGLESFVGYNNRLDHIDLTNNRDLLNLYCFNNRLASLDLSYCPKLEFLDCRDNELSQLNLSSCNKLLDINCGDNPLSSLDLRGKTDLVWLMCDSCSLETLDLSGLSSLTILNCYNNHLTSLNLDGCDNLEEIDCIFNELATLDVSMCSALTFLHCAHNEMSQLDVSGCTALEDLYCYSNQLSTLDLSCCPSLRYVYCFANRIQGEGMDNLIASLPQVTSMGYIFIGWDSSAEGQNILTYSQFCEAWMKNWGFAKRTSEDESYVYYYMEPCMFDQTVSAGTTFSLPVINQFVLDDNLKTLQFDVYLPDGFNLVNVEKTSLCGQQATLSYQSSDHYNNGRRYRRVILSNADYNYSYNVAIIDTLLVMNIQAPNLGGDYLLSLEGIKDAYSNIPLSNNPYNSYVKLTVEGGSMRGDVNGDGKANITDVTALIDYLLSGAVPPAAADCNRDGNVNITDVTTLIDYLLSSSWPSKVTVKNAKPLFMVPTADLKLEKPVRAFPLRRYDLDDKRMCHNSRLKL